MKKYLVILATVIVGFVGFDLAFGQDVYKTEYTKHIVNKILYLTTAKAEFRDTGIYINSPADGKLLITSDGTGNDDITITGTTVFSNRTLLSSAVSDTNAFTAVATADTVVISGVTTTSIFVVSGMYLGGVDQQDVLQWDTRADTLIVYRLAAGESAGKYSWFWLR